LARQAAIKLARERREPSEGKRLLAAFSEFFSVHRPMLASAEVQGLLSADPTGEWADYHGRGRSITQREIALGLDPYDIHPTFIHQGRKTVRGYRIEQFAQAFKHYLAESPSRKRATVRKERGKRRKERTVARLQR
jgi:putative DNA primase/helicase